MINDTLANDIRDGFAELEKIKKQKEELRARITFELLKLEIEEEKALLFHMENDLTSDVLHDKYCARQMKAKKPAWLKNEEKIAKGGSSEPKQKPIRMKASKKPLDDWNNDLVVPVNPDDPDFKL